MMTEIASGIRTYNFSEHYPLKIIKNARKCYAQMKSKLAMACLMMTEIAGGIRTYNFSEHSPLKIVKNAR